MRRIPARDVSASRVHLEMTDAFEIGAYVEMQFDIGAQFEDPTIVRCAGHMIRVDQRAGPRCVALHVHWDVCRKELQSNVIDLSDRRQLARAVGPRSRCRVKPSFCGRTDIVVLRCAAEFPRNVCDKQSIPGESFAL